MRIFHLQLFYSCFIYIAPNHKTFASRCVYIVRLRLNNQTTPWERALGNCGKKNKWQTVEVKHRLIVMHVYNLLSRVIFKSDTWILGSDTPTHSRNRWGGAISLSSVCIGAPWEWKIPVNIRFLVAAKKKNKAKNTPNCPGMKLVAHNKNTSPVSSSRRIVYCLL